MTSRRPLGSGDQPGPDVERAAITAELARCRDDLLALVQSATCAELRAPSNGTKWTNEQLLFHMVFGFLVVRRLLPLVRVISVLPSWVGRSFAALLDAARAPFHAVNYAGSCAGALVFNHTRMGRLCDHTVGHLIASLAQEPEERLGRGMRFPASWDPYFEGYMTLAAVYAYPVLHYDHHRRQLTLASVT
ncbi:DinB family protein [Terrabacter sp. NPDC000476]|uniref:DinB family protein n=1 Tax=Terrabacter sp. NPDC000476 TaxID=3154258 RepID=UPI0033265A54